LCGAALANVHVSREADRRVRAITGEPVEIRDIAVEPGYPTHLREMLIRSGYRSVVAVPLLRENHLLGAFAVNRDYSR